MNCLPEICAQQTTLPRSLHDCCSCWVRIWAISELALTLVVRRKGTRPCGISSGSAIPLIKIYVCEQVPSLKYLFADIIFTKDAIRSTTYDCRRELWLVSPARLYRAGLYRPGKWGILQCGSNFPLWLASQHYKIASTQHAVFRELLEEDWCGIIKGNSRVRWWARRMAIQGPAELATNHVLRAGRFRSECVYALCHAEDELLSLHVHYSSSK